MIVVYLDTAKLSVPSDDNFGMDLSEMTVAFLDTWMIQYTMKKTNGKQSVRETFQSKFLGFSVTKLLASLSGFLVCCCIWPGGTETVLCWGAVVCQGSEVVSGKVLKCYDTDPLGSYPRTCFVHKDVCHFRQVTRLMMVMMWGVMSSDVRWTY